MSYLCAVKQLKQTTMEKKEIKVMNTNDNKIRYEFFAVELNSYYGPIITIIGNTKKEVRKRAKELKCEDYIWEIRKHRTDTMLPYQTMIR